MADEETRIVKVRAAGGRVLSVRFTGERRGRRLDLTGLIARSARFAPLMDDPDAFAKVSRVEDRLGVAWPIETRWGRLDLSAATLLRVADEQEPEVTPPRSVAWPRG